MKCVLDKISVRVLSKTIRTDLFCLIGEVKLIKLWGEKNLTTAQYSKRLNVYQFCLKEIFFLC
jgi:hypothetical protein